MSRFNSRNNRPLGLRIRLFGGLIATALALLLPMTSHAEVVLEGNVEDIYQVGLDECPGCTAGQLSELQAGLDMALDRMRTLSQSSTVCVAKASLARDMAVVTHEAVRLGAIHAPRWRDKLRANAATAAGLSEGGLDALLTTFGREVAAENGISLGADSRWGSHVDIYTSVQLARIFQQMAWGTWDPALWYQALASTSTGLGPSVDSVMRWSGSGRVPTDGVLVASDPVAVWLTAELDPLTRLPPDFMVGGVVAARDALYDNYHQTVIDEEVVAMANGCGTEVVNALAFAIIDQTPSANYLPQTNDVLDQEPEPYDGGGGVITVTGELPPLLPPMPRYPIFPPYRPPSSPGDNGRGGGGSGQSPPDNPGDDWTDDACDPETENCFEDNCNVPVSEYNPDGIPCEGIVDQCEALRVACLGGLSTLGKDVALIFKLFGWKACQDLNEFCDEHTSPWTWEGNTTGQKPWYGPM